MEVSGFFMSERGLLLSLKNYKSAIDKNIL